ncbi:MAG: ion transporter, partial [Phycisphaerales bacterium]|nr:ion transporter [Phycisphaerales bacterium]
LFRIFKLSRYVGESEILMAAMRASRPKITVFLVGVLTTIVIIGALMYMVEGPEHGFTSIPQSIYWAVVTLTTVGYGDIAPQTTLGKMLASGVMILGYGVLAVPTGIVTAEITQATRGGGRRCESCGAVGHHQISNYCHICGGELIGV